LIGGLIIEKERKGEEFENPNLIIIIIYWLIDIDRRDKKFGKWKGILGEK
jgi:hypothetical protein